jgi:hypothetical protein
MNRINISNSTLTSTLSLIAALSFNALAQNNLPSASRSEILFTDSQGAILNANSGSPSLVASGQKLVRPLGIAIANNGDMIVSDTGCGALLAIDAAQNQKVIAQGGALGVPFGIAIEKSGSILVANARFIVRVNPQGQQILSSGTISTVPIAVTVAPNGDIFAVDALGIVVQVDPATGAQTRIAAGGYLKRPQGIAVLGNHIYVTDVATPDGNFGTGIVIDIDRQTGNQTLLSWGDKLVGPVGIAIDDAGKLIVGDPYTINPATANSDSGGYDGAILSIDRATGAQNVITRGQGDFVNPRCVAIVHSAN